MQGFRQECTSRFERRLRPRRYYEPPPLRASSAPALGAPALGHEHELAVPGLPLPGRTRRAGTGARRPRRSGRGGVLGELAVRSAGPRAATKGSSAVVSCLPVRRRRIDASARPTDRVDEATASSSACIAPPRLAPQRVECDVDAPRGFKERGGRSHSAEPTTRRPPSRALSSRAPSRTAATTRPARAASLPAPRPSHAAAARHQHALTAADVAPLQRSQARARDAEPTATPSSSVRERPGGVGAPESAPPSSPKGRPACRSKRAGPCRERPTPHACAYGSDGVPAK